MAGILYLKQGFNKKYDRTEDYYPSVSIVVSFHNEEKNARTLIERLIAQNYPQDRIEMILIDDRSVDNTNQILNRYTQNSINIKILTIRKISPGIAPKKQAIDQGIKAASGEIILLTDADGRPGPNWVRSMISYFKEKTGMVIGYAPYQTSRPYNNFLFKLLALEYLSHAAIAASSTGIGFPVTCVATNIAYRKEVYFQLGGFGKFASLPSGDDDLFLQRVREETDWEICYANIPENHVTNAPPLSWHQFYHQRLRYSSKGFLYPFGVTLALVAFFILNLLFFLLAILSFWYSQILYTLMIGLVLKGSVEFSFLKNAKEYLNDPGNEYLFPIAFILHIPYVIFFSLLTQIHKYRWAETNR